MNFTPADMDRFWSKVEKTEGCWQWVASKSPDHYGRFWFERRGHRAHRIAYEMAKAPIPSGMMLDHLCFNRGCVNPDHLRPVTVKQNGEHRAGPQRNSKTGIRGVQFKPQNNKYIATVVHHGKRQWLGTFDTATQAEDAAIKARAALFTHDDATYAGL